MKKAWQWLRDAVSDIWYEVQGVWESLLDILPLIFLLLVIAVAVVLASCAMNRQYRFADAVMQRCQDAGHCGAIKMEAGAGKVYYFCFSGDPIEYHPVPGWEEMVK